MPYVAKRWLVKEKQEEKTKNLLAEMPQLSPVTAKILVNRGLTNKQQVESFLAVDLQNLHNPFLLKDMDKAVKRIVQALEEKEQILVYGDYDVDGITSTTLLFSVLNSLGGLVQYYLPHRLEEGYGLRLEALEASREKGTSLLITVDCGISAHQEIEWAQNSGLDVIVTDHHHPGETLPSALAVINPKREDCSYPFKELAGVGVAYKLAEALISQLGIGQEILPSLRELVAVGTIADIVPLVYENRILVQHGLTSLQKTKRLGLLALKKVAGLEEKEFDTYSIGFAISPRLNALGRLCSQQLPLLIQEKLRNSASFTTVDNPNVVRLGVELLLTESPEEAKEIAEFLNEENKKRQELESIIVEKAVSLLEEQWNPQKERVIVLGSEDWHLGVIGIVASRLVERYYRPVILLNFSQGTAKGSARSIKGFHLFEALQECSELLEKYGGHELAAGLTLKEKNIGAFREKINLLAEKYLTETDLIPSLSIEVADINLDNLSFDLLEQLEMLAPYGCGNPKPILSCANARFLEYRAVGSNSNHLKIKTATGQQIIDGIGFNLGAYSLELDSGKRYNLAFALEKNDWKGKVSLQLKLEDLKETKVEKEKEVSTWVEKTFSTFCYTEIVGNDTEEKGKLLENLSIGEFIFFRLDSKNRVVRVENSTGQLLGFLNNRLEKKIRPYLKTGLDICPWVVTKQNKLKIAFNLEANKTEASGAKKTIFLYPTPLEAIAAYKGGQGRDKTALGHSALSSWKIGEIVGLWQADILDTLLLSKQFYNHYQYLFGQKAAQVQQDFDLSLTEQEINLIGAEWQELVPSRDFLAGLYRGLKAKLPQGSTDKTVFISLDLEEIKKFLTVQGLVEVTRRQIQAGLDTLEEMSLLEREVEGEKHYIYRLPTPQGKLVLHNLLRYQEDMKVQQILENVK